MPKHNLILFYACSFDGTRHWAEKSKASEKANKWKVIIHNRPDELKAGEMTFGCEILWATERETRKFPSRGFLRVSWAGWKVRVNRFVVARATSKEFVKEFPERRRGKSSFGIFRRTTCKNPFAIFQMSCQTRIARKSSRILLPRWTYRPIKRCKLRPKNNAKREDYKLWCFPQIFTEDAAAECFHLNACYLQWNCEGEKGKVVATIFGGEDENACCCKLKFFRRFSGVSKGFPFANGKVFFASH